MIPAITQRAIRWGAVLAVLPAMSGFGEIDATVGTTGFTHLEPDRTGIEFSNYISPETVVAFANIMPSGVAAGDIDGDGLTDLYFCSMDGANALYRNLGDWRFEDVTAQAGVACPKRRSLSATFADLDGDYDLDLVVGTRGETNSLFLNDGKGTFTEDMNFPGRNMKKTTTSIGVADIDGNGSLDLYLSNHRAHSYADSARNPADDPELQAELRTINAGGEPSAEFSERYYLDHGEFQEQGEPDDLLLNDGKGRFTRVGAEHFSMPQDARPAALNGWGLGVQFRDINRDGAPDLYVCNDFHTADRLWINDGTGHFNLAPSVAQRKMSWFSMTVDFADLNADGHLDFFVADMLSRDHARRKRQMGDMVSNSPQSDPLGLQPQAMQNTLFLGRGDNTFSEISAFAGLRASEWTWGAIFSDVNLDGLPDLLVSSGMIHDMMDADMSKRINSGNSTPKEIRAGRVLFPPIKTRNLLYLNQGNLKFSEQGSMYGFQRQEISGGMILADLDNDLDLDLIIANTGAPPEIYRNDVTAPRIAVRLHGHTPNTAGIGASVELTGADTTLQQEVVAGGRLTSGCDTTLVFAAPSDRAPFSLRVRWRSGQISTLDHAAVGQLHVIDESTATDAPPAPTAAPTEPLFEDVSARLGHRHDENAFEDFALQPLLPNRLSRLGPGVSWIDLDADHDDDIIVTAARGGTLSVLENNGDGSFRRLKVGDPAPGDITAVVGYASENGQATLLAGISNWEDANLISAGQLLDRQHDGTFLSGAAIKADHNSVGPVAMADVDRDGDLDIFLGGRVRRGRYPEPADSRLILNATVPSGTQPFDSSALLGLGLVSGATFADLDNDGDADLVVAREWDSPAVLINTGSRFEDATKSWGLDEFTGWWNGVAAGDLNGDGRIDLVVTNWGRNSKYEGAYSPDHPLRIYYGDLDASGTFDIVEAHHDKMTGKLVPERGLSCSSNAMPFVKRRTPTFAEFGMAELNEIYGERLDSAEKLEVRDLRHMVFLNTEKRFDAIPLPLEAQLAPSFGVAIADFNGDGHEDLVLAQNFFAVQIETPRNDGGRGLILLGDGTGGFRPLSATTSGLIAWGEGRGCAVADYDADGRPDILMAQSNDQTKLWHNRRARPGLRVRLEGAANNPNCIGASLQAISNCAPGPCKVINAGTGYWSQNSATRILTAQADISDVKVTWPDGTKEVITIPAGATSVVLRKGAPVTILR